MTGILSPLIAGTALAVALTLSPLTAIALPAAWVVITALGRGLPPAERRALLILLTAGFAARVIAIAALFLIGLPHHSDVSVGGLSGDDAYYFDRALRARDLMLGFAAGKYDYFVVSDEYGRTNYLKLLTAMQVAAGPTPYGMRVVNALMYVGGAGILYRVVRNGFGSIAALTGLAVLLALPSLFFWSISLLKESMFFLVTAILLASVMSVLTRPAAMRSAAFVAVAVVCLWLLDDLRRGGLVLASAGIVLAIAARVTFARPRRTAIALAVAIVVVVAAASSASMRTRLVAGVTAAAQVHAGHVFTVGHAYKLLDDGFYMQPRSPEGLTLSQSLRFVARAAVSFVVTPLPWQVQSRGELALLPEHLLWYVMLALAPIGIAAGWRRSPMLTCLLVGYLVPTAVTLAVTNGNVGTLLRLRALVTPQLVWISALGAVAVMDALLQRSTAPRSPFAFEGSAP